MARSFNGSSDNYSAGSDIVGAYPFTVCAFLRQPSSSSAKIFSVGNPSVANQHISCGFATNFRPHIRYDNGATGADIVLTPAGSADTWYRCLWVLNSSTDFRIYRDDGTSASSTSTISYPSATETYIGRRAHSTPDYWNGQIADISVLNVNVADSDARKDALLKGADPRSMFAPSEIILHLPLIRDIYDVTGRVWTTSGTTVTDQPGKIFAIPYVWDSTPEEDAGTTVNLTGNAATAAVGGVTSALSETITGNAATAAVGDVTEAITHTLTGEAGTASVGDVTSALDMTLTGEAAAAAVGDVTRTVGKNVSVTGVAATAAVGAVTSAIDNILTGEAGTASVGDVTSALDMTLTGEAATGAVGDVTKSVGKNVSVTGIAATGAVGDVTSALDMTLTGEAATGAVGDVTASTPSGLIGRRHRSRRARWYQGEVVLGEIIDNKAATKDLVQEAVVVGGLARKLAGPYQDRGKTKRIAALSKDAKTLKRIIRAYRAEKKEREREDLLLLL